MADLASGTGDKYTGAAWRVTGSKGLDSLELERDNEVPELGDHDCLVKIEAASLNYRDVLITQGLYPFPMAAGVVPGSDGAGTIIAVGDRVTQFGKGDKVCTILNQGHLAGSLTPQTFGTGLGASLDGTFCQHGVFDESGLVRMPKSLSFREASTLPCAAVTAWNALYGLSGQSLKPGQVVLTLGTGGVSMFAIQFAVAAGAIVISTTSTSDKEDMLRGMGSHHVINYKRDVHWGTTAKTLTPCGAGVDFVVEVGGANTMAQSLAAIKIDGLIAVVGIIGGPSESLQEPSILNAWRSTCLVRGVAVGSRVQFEEMNRAIEAKALKPVVDEKVFKLDQLKEAYQYLSEQKHVGKVVVECH